MAEAIDELQMITLLSGEYDKNNAILTFHAGTGGTEAQDWADMLFRMYNRWAVAHGFKAVSYTHLPAARDLHCCRGCLWPGYENASATDTRPG